MLQVATIHTTDLPVQPLHDLQQAALAHVSVVFLEADGTQVLCCDPLLPVKGRLTVLLNTGHFPKKCELGSLLQLGNSHLGTALLLKGRASGFNFTPTASFLGGLIG